MFAFKVKLEQKIQKYNDLTPMYFLNFLFWFTFLKIQYWQSFLHLLKKKKV